MAMEMIIPPNFCLSVIIILKPMFNLIVRYAEARLEMCACPKPCLAISKVDIVIIAFARLRPQHCALKPPLLSSLNVEK